MSDARVDRFVRLAAVLGDDPRHLRWVRAPGRVNLMGDHTDYNDGFVLPLAVDLEALVAWRPSASGLITARSLELSGEVAVAADGRDAPAGVEPPWGRFVAGVARVLAARGRAPAGADLAVSSTVPPGAGLSSSAALSVSVALALVDAGDLAISAHDLARVCQEAERTATGVAGGIMDQLASLRGRDGSALLIDCRDLTVEPVPIPAAISVLVVHSGLPRTLAGTAYAARRAECERDARELGIETLRDATEAQVRDRPRARHVVRENARVLASVAALRRGRLDDLGHLLSESHASLRDDYDVSTPELDRLVELLVAAGAPGARLTGAGFGGCVVALTPHGQAMRIADAVLDRYRTETGYSPRAFEVCAVSGAGPLEPDSLRR